MSDYARKVLAEADALDFADPRAMAATIGALREWLRMVAPGAEVLADADSFGFESVRAMAALIGSLREALRMALAQ
ncbi:hypothetical protein [Streptomyces sp. CA-106110]|uniref:hypothetical protein n=1 Tax=Streptomyces sp. CA-106110 TaxID=3240044 RepID=UPI003D901616